MMKFNKTLLITLLSSTLLLSGCGSENVTTNSTDDTSSPNTEVTTSLDEGDKTTTSEVVEAMKLEDNRFDYLRTTNYDELHEAVKAYIDMYAKSYVLFEKENVIKWYVTSTVYAQGTYNQNNDKFTFALTGAVSNGRYEEYTEEAKEFYKNVEGSISNDEITVDAPFLLSSGGESTTYYGHMVYKLHQEEEI